jgi:hypothetical protein
VGHEPNAISELERPLLNAIASPIAERIHAPVPQTVRCWYLFDPVLPVETFEERTVVYLFRSCASSHW